MYVTKEELIAALDEVVYAIDHGDSRVIQEHIQILGVEIKQEAGKTSEFNKLLGDFETKITAQLTKLEGLLSGR